jgi:hypothetical protein
VGRAHTQLYPAPHYCRRQRQGQLARRRTIHASSLPDPMTTGAQGDPPQSLPLGPLLGNLPPHLLQQEVLRRLGPTDLASLAGAGRGCAAAVAATVLMQWAKLTNFYCWPLPRLCLKQACSHAARGGNLEVLEYLHNAGCKWDSATCAAAAMGGHLVWRCRLNRLIAC